MRAPKRIIYLHGFASGPSSQKAQFFLRKFAERGVDLIVPDLAAGDFRGLTITGQLRVIESVINSGPADEPFQLIGSSLGGYLAALWAARCPKIQRVVLFAPAFGFARRWSDRLGPEEMAAWRRTGTLRIPHYGMRTDADLGYQLIEDGAKYEQYPDVRQPTLIFHGDRDDIVPVELSRQFVLNHANARLVVLHSGHELTDVLDVLWQGASTFLLGEN